MTDNIKIIATTQAPFQSRPNTSARITDIDLKKGTFKDSIFDGAVKKLTEGYKSLKAGKNEDAVLAFQEAIVDLQIVSVTDYEKEGLLPRIIFANRDYSSKFLPKIDSIKRSALINISKAEEQIAAVSLNQDTSLNESRNLQAGILSQVLGTSVLLNIDQYKSELEIIFGELGITSKEERSNVIDLAKEVASVYDRSLDVMLPDDYEVLQRYGIVDSNATYNGKTVSQWKDELITKLANVTACAVDPQRSVAEARVGLVEGGIIPPLVPVADPVPANEDSVGVLPLPSEIAEEEALPPRENIIEAVLKDAGALASFKKEAIPISQSEKLFARAALIELTDYVNGSNYTERSFLSWKALPRATDIQIMPDNSFLNGVKLAVYKERPDQIEASINHINKLIDNALKNKVITSKESTLLLTLVNKHDDFFRDLTQVNSVELREYLLELVSRLNNRYRLENPKDAVPASPPSAAGSGTAVVPAKPVIHAITINDYETIKSNFVANSREYQLIEKYFSLLQKGILPTSKHFEQADYSLSDLNEVNRVLKSLGYSLQLFDKVPPLVRNVYFNCRAFINERGRDGLTFQSLCDFQGSKKEESKIKLANALLEHDYSLICAVDPNFSPSYEKLSMEALEYVDYQEGLKWLPTSINTEEAFIEVSDLLTNTERTVGSRDEYIKQIKSKLSSIGRKFDSEELKELKVKKLLTSFGSDEKDLSVLWCYWNLNSNEMPTTPKLLDHVKRELVDGSITTENITATINRVNDLFRQYGEVELGVYDNVSTNGKPKKGTISSNGELQRRIVSVSCPILEELGFVAGICPTSANVYKKLKAAKSPKEDAVAKHVYKVYKSAGKQILKVIIKQQDHAGQVTEDTRNMTVTEFRDTCDQYQANRS